MTEATPPIPAWLSHLPVSAGMAVPWITPQTSDGRYLFGTLHPTRHRQAIVEHRCQICGRVLTRPMVLLLRLSDLPRQATSEPGLHPVCAAYTTAACPMVGGRMSHYRSTPHRLDPTMLAAPDTPTRLGKPAELWVAVWLATYTPVIDPRTGGPAASYVGIRPFRIRPVALTGRGMPW